MYVDLWGWFWQEEIRARRADDARVSRLVALARKGWAYRRSAEGEKMLATFREATALAKEINHPCWELFCMYWSCSTLFYHVNDLQGAMHETVALISRAHLPHFEQCPIRGRIYFLLADIYYEMDVFGYEDKIRAALSHLSDHIAIDEDTYFRVQHRLADLAYLHEDYELAFERVTTYMAQTQDNRFRMRSAHQLLQAIAFAHGDIPTALEHAQQVAFYAHDIKSHVDVGVSLLWQAAYVQRLGNPERAALLHAHALYLFEAYDLSQWLDYYNARCDYLEKIEEVALAVRLREEQIAEYTDYGSVWYLGQAYLQLARLLGRIGDDVDTVLEQAERLATQMLKPASYLSKVERIRKGDYYEFAWQGVMR